LYGLNFIAAHYANMIHIVPHIEVSDLFLAIEYETSSRRTVPDVRALEDNDEQKCVYICQAVFDSTLYSSMSSSRIEKVKNVASVLSHFSFVKEKGCQLLTNFHGELYFIRGAL
jgi:hypothetical protein